MAVTAADCPAITATAPALASLGSVPVISIEVGPVSQQLVGWMSALLIGRSRQLA
jgi:hypothetical protein